MFIIIVPLFNPDIYLWLITEIKEFVSYLCSFMGLSWSLSASAHPPLANCGGNTNPDYRTLTLIIFTNWTSLKCFFFLKKKKDNFYSFFSFAVGHSIHLLWCSQSKQINKRRQIDLKAGRMNGCQSGLNYSGGTLDSSVVLSLFPFFLGLNWLCTQWHSQVCQAKMEKNR